MVPIRAGSKVKRNSFGRRRGDMKEVIVSFDHQKVYTRYGRIKAVHKMRLRRYGRGRVKGWCC